MTMRRILAAVLTLFLLAGTAAGGNPLLGTSGGTPSTAGPGIILGNPLWWMRDLTFYAPLDDPSHPLAISRGTGTFTFTRAHDATHTATYVHPTTGFITVADNNQLRIEANGAFLEGARTNGLTYSENIGAGSDWTVTGTTTLTVDNTTSPGGTLTADKITDTSNSSSFGVYQAFAYSAATYTFSVYGKYGSGNGWLVVDFANGANKGAVFDLTDGSIGFTDAGVTSSITSFGSGWYRCAVTIAMGAGTSYPEVYLSGSRTANTRIHAGDGTNSVYVWGLDLEQGASLTSYIPTVLTAMTRNQDVLTLPTIASPGTAIATLDGVAQEIDYATFDPALYHTKQLRVWNRILSAEEIAVLAP